MAEFYSRVYIKPPKSIELKHFTSLLDCESEISFLEAAAQLNPESGRDLARNLLKAAIDFVDICPEGNTKFGAVYAVQYVLGRDAEQLITKLLLFYEQLINPIDLRAYMSGDDDPWESFYRVEDNKIVEEECVPDDADSDEMIQTIYAWWHQGLPRAIFEGHLVNSRAEIPAPKKPIKNITKTKITVPDVMYWEMMFFMMLPDKKEVPEEDDINTYWEGSWDGSDEEYQQVMRAFKRLRIDYVRYSVDFKRLEGIDCNISYNFSGGSANDNYSLTYASFCALIGAEIKQFVTEYPTFKKHYIFGDGTVTVETRQGRETTSSEVHNINAVFSESD